MRGWYLALAVLAAAAGWWWWRRRQEQRMGTPLPGGLAAAPSTASVLAALQSTPPGSVPSVQRCCDLPTTPVKTGLVAPSNTVNGSSATKPKNTPAKPIGPCQAGKDWKLYGSTGTPYWACVATKGN